MPRATSAKASASVRPKPRTPTSAVCSITSNRGMDETASPARSASGWRVIPRPFRGQTSGISTSSSVPAASTSSSAVASTGTSKASRVLAEVWGCSGSSQRFSSAASEYVRPCPSRSSARGGCSVSPRSEARLFDAHVDGHQLTPLAGGIAAVLLDVEDQLSDRNRDFDHASLPTRVATRFEGTPRRRGRTSLQVPSARQYGTRSGAWPPATSPCGVANARWRRSSAR